MAFENTSDRVNRLELVHPLVEKQQMSVSGTFVDEGRETTTLWELGPGPGPLYVSVRVDGKENIESMIKTFL